MKKLTLALLAACTLCLLAFYPINGYERTGIKRLIPLQETFEKGEKNSRLQAGSYLKSEQVALLLCQYKEASLDSLMTDNAAFEKKLVDLFGGDVSGYGITVMDLSDPTNLRYASHNETKQFQPGSVGKLAVAAGFFTELKKLCPNDWHVRQRLMKDRVVKAGNWGVYDHHTVPVYDSESETLVRRKVTTADEFSLYEWLDHMLSVSNNGAASIVWREALLMRAFGDKYFGLTQKAADEWFKNTDRGEITDIAIAVVNEPLRELGIGEDEWRLGKFFTSGANQYVGREGGSTGTPRGLMKFLLAVEQGRLADEASSLELKRLMYLTDRRIRYASSPALDSAAVYFKSGSFYKCDRNKKMPCGEYAGNEFNYMNSVITVEHRDTGKRYIVCLMSNVLGKNSAWAHRVLGGTIDEVVTASAASL